MRRVFFCVMLMFFLFGGLFVAGQELNSKEKAKLDSIVKARLINKLEIGSEVTANLIFLIKAGAGEEFLLEADSLVLSSAVYDIRERNFPLKLVKKLSLEPNKDVLKDIRKNIPESDKQKLKDRLKTKAAKKNHMYRSDLEGNDYGEEYSSLDKVSDGITLQLILRVYEFFDKNENICELNSLFPKGSDSDETGGVYLFEQRHFWQSVRTVFVRLPPPEGGGSAIKYNPALSVDYLPIFADIHTHPSGNEEPNMYSAPSLPDLNWLKYKLKTRTHLISVVATYIDKNIFNLDIDFADSAGVGNREHPYLFVIDLGIYECKTDE